MPTKLAVLAVLLCSLIGCGGSSSNGSSSGYPSVTGDWGFTLQSSVNPINNADLGLYLTQSGTGVRGIAYMQSYALSICYPANTPIPLTGTVDSYGNLTLTSTAVSGQVLTVLWNVSSGPSLADAGYSIAGGCQGGDSGTMTGAVVQPLMGKYTSSIDATTGVGGSISFTVAQGSSVDSSGFFHLSGNATFTGSPCVTQAAIADPATDTEALGSNFQMTFTVPSSSTQIVFTGSQWTDGTTIYGIYRFVSGPCANNGGMFYMTN